MRNIDAIHSQIIIIFRKYNHHNKFGNIFCSLFLDKADITIIFPKFIISYISIRSRIVAYFVANIMHLFVKLTDYYQRIILLILAGLI